MRAHSALAAMGRWLDAEGKLPKPWLDSYKDEATMKELWDIALAEAVKHKANVAAVLEGRERGPGRLSHQRRGHRPELGFDRLQPARDGFGYIAPKEGAFAWNQGFALMLPTPRTSIRRTSSPSGSQRRKDRPCWATAFSANPVAKGAIDLASAEVKEFYNAALPGDARRSSGGGRRRRLVHQAARRIRRQVHSRIRQEHHRDRRIPLRDPAVFCCAAASRPTRLG